MIRSLFRSTVEDGLKRDRPGIQGIILYNPAREVWGLNQELVMKNGKRDEYGGLWKTKD